MQKKFAEKFLYHIWDEQHISKNLITEDKKKLEILFQGKWNTFEGPDFRSAIILFNEKKLQGDVEIHRSENDWILHKHHEDKNYNDVILHVVFQKNNSNKYTISENGTKIPILILKNNLDKQINKLWQKYGTKKFDKEQKETIPCHLAKSIISEDQLLGILLKFGKTRFQKKIKRFSAELYNSDFNQILYKGIFEALGYSKNKISFLKLAMDLSYTNLVGYFDLLDSPTDLFSLFVLKSGIDISKYKYKFINDDLISSFKSIKSKLKIDTLFNNHNSYDWNFFRLRPTNHPLYRLWQISPFLYSTLKYNLANKLFSIFSVSKQKIRTNKFKNEFYYLINQNRKRNYKLGYSRCNDIFVNIILPVGYLYAETLNYKDLKETIEKTYKNMSKLSENYITKYIRARMSDIIINSRKIKLIHQQGMIQLYYQNCHNHDCVNCISIINK